ncbi:MAG: ABC transporter permease, partial [Phycisphaerales bacterium]|nr:ABC transporter permease [Phycisphaerales bacterium]
VLLSLAGGAAGLLLAYWGTRLLVAISPGNIPRLDEIAVDPRVLGFTLAISLLTGALFGLIPALQTARTDLGDSLKEGGKSSATGSSHHWLRNALVVGETALALVLLIGAGLLFTSFLKLRDTNAGFNPESVLAVDLSLPSARYAEPLQQTGFFKDLLERIKVRTGVQSAGAISFLPLASPGAATSFFIEGEPTPPPGQTPVADVRAVTPDFFRAMGIALLRGRVFTERDTAGAPLGVVINESMINMFWPNEDPLGKRINMPWGQPMIAEIIGIVNDVRLVGLDTPPRATLYWAHQQFPYGSMTVLIRSTNDPATLAAAVKHEVQTMDKDQPIASIRTMDEVVAAAVARLRFNSTLMLIFASVALVLASVGIYGVMSFAVTQRTHEIGIRIALGARPGEVLRMVVAQGMTLAIAGVGIGILVSIAFTRAMVSLLYQVKPTDPTTYVLVS